MVMISYIKDTYIYLIGDSVFSYNLKCIDGVSYYKYKNENHWRRVSNSDFILITHINGISEQNKNDIMSGRYE